MSMAAVSGLARRLAEGHQVVTAEVNPPRHAGLDELAAEARRLAGVVDAVNLTDCSRALVRMGSTAAAVVVRDEGVEPVVQLTCRDRNRIALQSELLGLPALGLHNVLLLRGDDPSAGDHPDATPVFDLDGTGLLRAAAGLADEGRLLSGRVVEHGPALFVGAAGDPDRDLQHGRLSLADKVAAGARFVQTQAVFDLERFATWMAQVRHAELHDAASILVGVFVVDTARRAEVLRDKVGMVVPDEVVARLSGAPDPRSEGIAIAVELVDALLATAGVAGVHLYGLEDVEDRVAVVERSSAGRRR